MINNTNFVGEEVMGRKKKLQEKQESKHMELKPYSHFVMTWLSLPSEDMHQVLEKAAITQFYQ